MLCESSAHVDELNVVDCLIQLPSLLNAPLVDAFNSTPVFQSFLKALRECVDLDSLSREMHVALYLHTMVMNTVMYYILHHLS